MTEAKYLFLSFLLCFLPLAIHQYWDCTRRMTLTCHTRSHKKKVLTLSHTHTYTHAVPFLLTYPELSRDRLAVTQCCPATSDLPESSKRADPWLTTEIQLPNQAGSQEEGDGGYSSKGGWAERKKCN